MSLKILSSKISCSYPDLRSTKLVKTSRLKSEKKSRLSWKKKIWLHNRSNRSQLPSTGSSHQRNKNRQSRKRRCLKHLDKLICQLEWLLCQQWSWMKTEPFQMSKWSPIKYSQGQLKLRQSLKLKRQKNWMKVILTRSKQRLSRMS